VNTDPLLLQYVCDVVWIVDTVWLVLVSLFFLYPIIPWLLLPTQPIAFLKFFLSSFLSFFFLLPFHFFKFSCPLSIPFHPLAHRHKHTIRDKRHRPCGDHLFFDGLLMTGTQKGEHCSCCCVLPYPPSFLRSSPWPPMETTEGFGVWMIHVSLLCYLSFIGVC